MVSQYSVLGRDAEAEIVERKSRFLASARRVSGEDAAREVIDQCRRRSREAGHHCSAFVLGAQGEITRTSDDGEPSGTAGMPILEVIKGRGLSDTVVVVTRWFGGVKLGTGGLARAYGDAATAAVEVAGCRRRQLVRQAVLPLDLSQAPRVENDLRTRPEAARLGVGIESVDYTADGASLRLTVPVENWQDAGAWWAQMRWEWTPGEQRWVDR